MQYVDATNLECYLCNAVGVAYATKPSATPTAAVYGIASSNLHKGSNSNNGVNRNYGGVLK